MVRWIITIGFCWLSALISAQGLNHQCYKNQKVNKIPELHTDWLEFSPISYQNGLLFIAPEKVDRIDDQELKSPFFRIQYWGPGDIGQIERRFSEINESDGHIGPLVMTEDERTLYYTYSYSTNKAAKTEIWRAILRNDKYQDLERVDIFEANQGYSYQHPSLGDNLMIFSSNKGEGSDFDLWIVRQENGQWLAPQQLSDSINTEANEAFPFIYQDSILFFSSNRGESDSEDFDIYYSFRTLSGWTKAAKLEKPLNSNYDDLGFSISDSKDAFYWTSNRDGNQTGDDIYTMAVDKSRLTASGARRTDDSEGMDTIELNIKVVEQTPQGVYSPLADVELISYALGKDYKLDLASASVKELRGMENQKGLWVSILPDHMATKGLLSDTITIDDAGQLIKTVASDNYLLKFNKKGYDPVYRFVVPDQVVEKMDVVMHRKVTSPVEPQKSDNPDISKINALRERLFADTDLVVFDQLYYDYGSSTINAESVQELDRLAVFMQAYPKAKVQLISHTDSRGNAKFNLRLSEKRAQSAKHYLVNQGIRSSRIEAIGRGEQELRNHCSSGVYCSEEEHEYNRRTEVRVIMN